MLCHECAAQEPTPEPVGGTLSRCRAVGGRIGRRHALAVYSLYSLYLLFSLYIRCICCMMYAYREGVIHRIIQLYGVIHETRIVSRPYIPIAAIHRDTAMYEHTVPYIHTASYSIHVKVIGLAAPSRSVAIRK